MVDEKTETETPTNTDDVEAEAEVKHKPTQRELRREDFNNRVERFQNATRTEKAILKDGRSIDTLGIVEAVEKDEYIRVGNLTYPAPVPRPVGAVPSKVEEAAAAAVEEDNKLRKDAEKTEKPKRFKGG